MLLLSHRDVEALLDLDRLVDVVAAAMADLSAGRASMPPRVGATVADRGALLGVMPAYLPSSGALTAKLVSVFPQNTDRPTHQALICCFDPADGTPLAVMDGTFVTATRTAAGSALATRLLARADARIVAVVGAGVQARTHVAALRRHHGVEAVRVAGRDPARATRLAAEFAGAGAGAGPPVESWPAVEEAVRSADVVCLATHADAPVVRRGWLRPGTHLNSVGYNWAGSGEVDRDTVRDAVVVVESRAAALAAPPAGAVELLRAIDEGAITPSHIRAEIGELVAGTAVGRTDDLQLTLYKSVGVAVQDAAAAAIILQAAREQGLGTIVAM